MYKILIILIILFIFTIFCHNNNQDPDTFNNFMKNTNKMIPNYKNNLFVNPTEYKELNSNRLDREENKYEGIQPKDIYFDIFLRHLK